MLDDGQSDDGAALETCLPPTEMKLLYDECREKLDEVEHDLLGGAEKAQELIHRMFRAFHSVKGVADFLGNDPLRELSQAAENVLGAMREGKLAMTPERAEALLSAVDRLRQMVPGANPSPADLDFRRESEVLNRMLDEVDLLSALHLGFEEEGMLSDPPGGRSTRKIPPQSPRRLKVLIVEDDFTSRVMLQCLLMTYGECHIAVNGKEAVEAFRMARKTSRAYDLVCMDIRMPEMDGTEAVQQIREMEEKDGVFSNEGVGIFMTTGVQDLKTVHASYKALCDAYLFKPIDGRQLREHMRSFGLIAAE